MTDHLRDEERIDALDGTLSASRVAHLDDCSACRQEVAMLRDVLAMVDADVQAADDMPPGMFWEHFPQRVAAAVAVAERPTPFWKSGARFWMAMATAAAVITMAVLVPQGPSAERPVTPTEVAWSADDTAFDAVHWAFVSDVLDSVEEDAVADVLSPRRGAGDRALQSLSAAERLAFARLLEAELAEGTAPGSE
jgi:hypothetical protein